MQSPPRASPLDALRRATDPMGGLEIPPGALWGAQTARALRQFAIGSQALPYELIHAIVRIKAAAAAVNARLGRIDAPLAAALEAAAQEVLEGAHDAQFPLSPWQSGSGTQSHVNVNEVLARLAELRLGGGRRVHPDDEVNRGQSSNDVLPSALHVALRLLVRERLLPPLDALDGALATHAALYDDVVKLGRTHLQDAVPLTLGAEIGAWRSQLMAARAALEHTLPGLATLAIGGMAVGTGLHTHPQFAQQVCRELSARTGIEFVPADDRCAAIAGAEPLVAFHGALKTLAVALSKIANDLRLLACGPRAGLGELRLPADQPGSPILPGRVNPTQCEALLMVCLQVMANDLAVTLGAAGGMLQLNTCRPLLAVNTLASVRLLGDACAAFEEHTLRGLVADRERIAELLGRSLMLVIALVPHIGHDRAARIAQRAHAQGSTLREAALAEGIAAADFDRWADPRRMLGPT